MKFKSMMVVIDPTESVPRLLGKVMQLANAFRPRIEFFVCDTEQSASEIASGRPVGVTAFAERRAELRQRRLASLEVLAAPLRALDLEVSVEATWHEPLHDGIVRHVLKTRPDLVIKQSHAHAPMPREFTMHTDWMLVRDCPAPLLLVKREHCPDRPRIAAAVDPCRPAERGTALDRAILDASAAWCRALGGEREVFHVFEGAAHLPDETATPEATAQSFARAREAMRTLLASEANVRHLHYLEGDPVTQIAAHVQSGAFDLLVMGAVSRPRPSDPRVGGTATHVVEAVDCDVLVIKPAGFVSPMLTTAGTAALA